jgi:hypothetical protein
MGAVMEQPSRFSGSLTEDGQYRRLTEAVTDDPLSRYSRASPAVRSFGSDAVPAGCGE